MSFGKVPKTSATVLLSGGIDSTACAHLLQARGYATSGIFVDYGQVAVKPEERAARAVAERIGVRLIAYRVKNGGPFSAGELLGRNAFLLFSAIFLSGCRSGLIAIGIHAGTPYYDCSPAFVHSMERLINEHTDGSLRLIAPFLHWSKEDVFQYFKTCGIEAELTYSCEAGKVPPCGLCASCRDRRMLGC